VNLHLRQNCQTILLPSIFLPQRPRRKLHQRRHFPTGTAKSLGNF
jgi:hypothetical protein